MSLPSALPGWLSACLLSWNWVSCYCYCPFWLHSIVRAEWRLELAADPGTPAPCSCHSVVPRTSPASAASSRFPGSQPRGGLVATKLSQNPRWRRETSVVNLDSGVCRWGVESGPAPRHDSKRGQPPLLGRASSAIPEGTHGHFLSPLPR